MTPASDLKINVRYENGSSPDSFAFVALIILSVISGTIIETTVFLLGFVPLRLTVGGYHAKNHFRCLVILLFVYSAFLLVIFFLPASYRVLVITVGVLLSIMLVFLIAPSEDSNKPLNENEFVRFWRKSRVAITVYTILIGMMCVFIQTRYMRCP